jgi:CRISPR-associated protein Csd1
MILQALKEYYDRKADDPDSDIAPEGFEKKEIPFVVVIDSSGKFVALEDTREKIGKKMVGKFFLLPRSCTRSGSKSYATTFLLWDHIGYLFEYSKTDIPKDVERAANQNQTWKDSLEALPAELKTEPSIAALLKFYETEEGVHAVKTDPLWDECTRIPSCNMSFRVVGDAVPVPCIPAIKTYQKSLVQDMGGDAGDDVVARCLVSGEIGTIARTHSRTSINKDTKSLISFQKNSGYDSYGKEQGYNAPVSKSVEFAYTTGLNTLLKSSQRLLVGDAVTVFWSSRKTTLESDMPSFFNEPPKDDPDRGTRAVAALLQSVKVGAYVQSDAETRFYVLGLSPNSARISVRFWKVGTVPEMAEHFARHFEDIRICHGEKQQDYLSLFRLLVSTATQGKPENISPNLAGETMRAILEGLPYPQTLLQGAIRRIRAEQSKKDANTGKPVPNVTYPRAAIIKGCLNRLIRKNNPQQQEEITVSLDTTNTNIGYCLGRLFAVLEKIQSESHPGINATIRDKFYGAASSAPVTVFGNLMRLKNHHLAKLENAGRRVNFERLIGEVMSSVSDFPPHLRLEDQGRFAIGYYHQMQEFYTKKEKQD